MILRNLLAGGTLLFLASSAAIADTYRVTVSEGLTNGHAFDTVSGDPFSGSNTASATFFYTGFLTFDNPSQQNDHGAPGDTNSAFGFSASNISGYSGAGTVVYNGAQVADYSTLAGFLDSYGSSGSYRYGSYYTFDLGVLSAGTVLTLKHDDGVSLFQGNTRVGTSSSADTGYAVDQVTLTQTADTILRYARENGTPSVLRVTAVTPEPAGLPLLASGALGVLGLVGRRRRSC